MGQLLLWWVMVEALGLVGLPLTFRIFSARSDYGYPFAKLLTLLLVSYVAWLGGHLGVASYASVLWATIIVYLALSAWLFLSSRDALLGWLRAGGARSVLMHDALWTFGFAFFAWQRSLGSEIIGAEKFMDFAFFNTLARTSVMPPQDPWMSGEIFNYYYFGYLSVANLGRLMPMPTYLSYNLCVATLGGLAFSQATAVGLMLTRSLPFGLMSGMMMALIGNLDGVLQFFQKGGLTNFDYWRSTRIVGGDSTINEFPYFTVIHGDLHPHFIVLPVAIMLWALLSDPERRPSTPAGFSNWSDLRFYLPVAFVLASSIVISPWELPVSAMMTFVLLQRDASWWPLISWTRIRAALATGVLLVAAYVLYLPFYRHFAPPPGGVGVKFATSSLTEFLIVFGALLASPGLLFVYELTQTSLLSVRREILHAIGALTLLALMVAAIGGGGKVNLVFILLLLMMVGALVTAYRTEKVEDRIPALLVFGALAAVFACEIVFIKDAYGEKLYRMNTVFKLYFQAWILFVLGGPWCLQKLLQRATPATRNLALAFVGILLLASCAYPAGITMTRLGQRGAPPTLDGNDYLRRDHAGDFGAIEWLRHNVTDMPVILEASGNPYSYYARFSSNVGIPTVMGWANHEGLWRSHEPIVQQRVSDVTRIYNARTLEEVTPVLDQYGVKYIAVGELERHDYSAEGLAKFNSLKVAVQSGNTVIYER